ncbi:hypothetical protein GCM10028806_33180 [Spirosoma terrae]|uniref:Uncharacterized protein n=1 Tax=Spirosoma terrae TaxID=1968276 RepID=A0A6L9L8G0_9BACT|nr:hypothetical protein [Spirosoma terrae]NDU95632.1 hypothetical protein [Spirosoma terrae]
MGDLQSEENPLGKGLYWLMDHPEEWEHLPRDKKGPRTPPMVCSIELYKKLKELFKKEFEKQGPAIIGNDHSVGKLPNLQPDLDLLDLMWNMDPPTANTKNTFGMKNIGGTLGEPFVPSSIEPGMDDWMYMFNRLPRIESKPLFIPAPHYIPRQQEWPLEDYMYRPIGYNLGESYHNKKQEKPYKPPGSTREMVPGPEGKAWYLSQSSQQKKDRKKARKSQKLARKRNR